MQETVDTYTNEPNLLTKRYTDRRRHTDHAGDGAADALRNDTAFTAGGYGTVEVGWLPSTQTLTDTQLTRLALVITNTGNSLMTYDLTFEGAGLDVLGTASRLRIPARTTSVVLVRVAATSPAPIRSRRSPAAAGPAGALRPPSPLSALHRR